MRRTSAAPVLAALAPVLLLGLVGCGPSEPPRTSIAESGGLPPTDAPIQITSGTLLDRYFPLLDGYVYSYVTTNDGGEPGVLTSTAARSSPTHGELRFANGARRFEYTPEGIVSASSGAFILKAPLSVGSTWRGEHGGVTRVAATDVAAVVLAGRFEGCVHTIEERLGDRPVRYDTTFCPNVGVVMLQVNSGAGLERAELKSYGPPMRLGPDGLVRIPSP